MRQRRGRRALAGRAARTVRRTESSDSVMGENLTLRALILDAGGLPDGGQFVGPPAPGVDLPPHSAPASSANSGAKTTIRPCRYLRCSSSAMWNASRVRTKTESVAPIAAGRANALARAAAPLGNPVGNDAPEPITKPAP